MKSKMKTPKKAPVPATSVTPVPVKEELEDKAHKLPDDFDLNQASTALSTIITHIQNVQQNSIFEDAPVRINLDVEALKIPDGLGHFVNINLPHSPYPTNPDILFIIPDDKRNNTEPEQLVNRMKDKLRESNITNIREVMTVTQVRNDFSTYEAKRELAKRIDVVIGMKSIFTLLPPILGREFYKKKKIPLALELHNEDDWSKEFEEALKRTVFNISLNGRTSTVLVGHSNLTNAQLTDNISKITNWLMRLYPGGWANVNQLSLNTPGIPPLMIYLGTGTRNDVGKAVTNGRKVAEPVVGEVSTLPGKRVKIHPYGNIDVLSESDPSDNEESDASESDDNDDEGKKEKGKTSIANTTTAKDTDSDEEEVNTKQKKKLKKSERDINTAERNYVEAVFRRQEFEDSQTKKKRESSEKERVKSTPSKKRKSKA